VDIIYAQLFYFPILYAAYFYPRRGLYFAGACAVMYECLVYVYVFPDISGMIYTTEQAILFICIAALVAYFTEKVNSSEARYRSIFETSLLGIVLFDQNSFAITLANIQLENMLGYTREELTRMTFAQLFLSKEEQHRFFEFLGSSEDITNFETLFVSKSHKPVWVNLSWRRIDGNLVSCSVIDVNTRKLAEEAADENYTRYKQVTESSPTGIVIVRNQKIVYANPAFRSFSGYEPDELAGKDFIPMIHPEDRDKFPDLSGQKDASLTAPGMAVYRFHTKSGEIRLGALFFTPILLKGERAVLINLADITEREQLKERIAQDNDHRRGIISTVAHELRTPLQPVMEYLNLLTHDPKTYGVTDETRLILDRCAKSVDHERRIINQMLELSVQDSGKKPLVYSVFSVRDMVKTIIDTGGYLTKADLTIEIPPDLTFEADQEKISFVIESLLSNAVNYTKPPRKIRIVYQSLPKDTMHRLAIQDNGVGITDTRLDEIFEPLRLPDPENLSRKYECIGVSLPIAKKYIQMLGGYISVDSVINLGSTFTIHIPKQKPKGRYNGQH
jgi:PAS domain S-box-containing protein